MTSEEARFYVSQFDLDTFVVVDRVANAEVCICGEFGEQNFSAEYRAETLALLLNNAYSITNYLNSVNLQARLKKLELELPEELEVTEAI